MEHQRIAVMRVKGLPARCRAVVESMLVSIVRSQPFIALPGTDAFDLVSCTRWRRSQEKVGCVDCREVINGTEAELDALARELETLALQIECETALEVVA